MPGKMKTKRLTKMGVKVKKQPTIYSMDGKLKKSEPSEMNLQDMYEGEVDFESLVKQEYMKLHRQYRLMEADRLRMVQKGSAVHKQSKVLDQFLAERKTLSTDLENVTSRHWHNIDRESNFTILEILTWFEAGETDTANAIRDINELTRNVDQITKSVVDQRLKVQALFGMSLTVPEADRRKRILEDRLYHYTTKNDTMLAKNKAIRLEINLMLQLRMIYYETLVAVRRQSHACRTKMGEVVELSTQAYDTRDEAMIKVRALRDRSDKEWKQHVLEVKECQRILTHDTKLRNFMRLKNHVRDLGETASQRIKRINATKLHDLNVLLHAYKSTLKQILKGSSFSDMELLVQNYNEHEQRNFSCFKCITDLNHEASFWRDEILEMQAELEGLWLERKEQDKKWKTELEEFEEELVSQNEILDKTNRKWELAQNEMAELIHLLDGIFHASEASNSSVIRLLGSHAGITPQNAGMCIRVVEGRAAELLFKREQLEVRKSVEANNGALPKKATVQPKAKGEKGACGPFIPSIMMTGHTQEDDGDEDDRSLSERPYSYEEMRAKVLAKLSMKVLSLGDPDETDSLFDAELESVMASMGPSRNPSIMIAPPKMKDRPTTATPSKEAPATTEAPATQAPATETPAADTPATDTPATDTDLPDEGPAQPSGRTGSSILESALGLDPEEE